MTWLCRFHQLVLRRDGKIQCLAHFRFSYDYQQKLNNCWPCQCSSPPTIISPMYIWLLAAWLPLLFLSPRFALFVGSLCYGAFSLFRLGGQLIGWHLRRKTSARRRTILSKATSEATDEPTDPQESRSDDEGWEKIEYGTRSVSNGGKADSPRETVMGFFHPFR